MANPMKMLAKQLVAPGLFAIIETDNSAKQADHRGKDHCGDLFNFVDFQIPGRQTRKHHHDDADKKNQQPHRDHAPDALAITRRVIRLTFDRQAADGGGWLLPVRSSGSAGPAEFGGTLTCE
jgi:hypothetical protein